MGLIIVMAIILVLASFIEPRPRDEFFLDGRAINHRDGREDWERYL